MRRQRLRGRVSRPVPVPIATGGWDASSPISDMPGDRAIALVNMFPHAAKVSVRKGHESWATGLDDEVETVMSWNGPSTSKLFAAAATEVHDVTSSGAVSTPAITSLTNARFQHVNFGTSGGNFLWICNGADAPRHYNGSAWATPSITGVTATQIINVCVHKRRLFFALTGYLGFAYLDVESIAGAASLFNLAPIFDRGGYLMAIGTWTTDGGAGPDDFAVFVTSEGQAAVFAGTDPSNVLSWGVVGVYDVGQPLGRRCLLSYGSDLLLLTVDGAVLMSRIVVRSKSDRQDVSVNLTANIRDAFAAATASYGSNYGWQAIEHPATNSLIINVPTSEGTTSEQFVMNSLTGAWTKYTGLNAVCWGFKGSQMYFGKPGGVVARAFGVESDLGIAIPWTYRGAFMNAKKDGSSAVVRMTQATMESSATLVASLAVNVDYREVAPDVPVPQAATGDVAIWDVSYWDQSYWGSGPSVSDDWISTPANGTSFGVHIIGQSSAETSLLALTVLMEDGRIF